MKRALTALLLAAGLDLSAGRGEAQVQIRIGTTNDSVLVVSGTTNRFWVTASNLPTGQTYLQAASLTFIYDPTLVDSIAAETVADTGFSTIATSTPRPGALTVTASGVAGGNPVNLFRLRVKLAAAAHDGGYLWARVDSLASPSYPGLADSAGGARTFPAQVCYATNEWGDVDGNGQVDSRDALITLSAAVGLPVGEPFASRLAQFGDVDQDGLVNSRDALMMLSYAIALPAATNRVGAPIPVCPGLTAPGETVVFSQSGNGIFRLDSLATVPVQLTTGTTDSWPRLNAADTTVAYQCSPNICLVNRSGANPRTLTGTGPMLSPEWSPDGTRLAFTQQVIIGMAVLYTMDASGANQTLFGSSWLLPRRVAWSHDGSKLAYADSGSGSVRTVTMDTTHTVLPLGPNGADLVRWSPGDTLVAYTTVGVNPIWAVPSVGGAARRLVTFPNTKELDWGPAGIVFSMPASGSSNSSLWLLKGGASGTLLRLTAPGGASEDRQPSLRRNP